MKILVVFFSMGGRTQLVAQAIAAELRNAEVNVEQLIYDGKMSDFAKNQENIKTGDLSHFIFDKRVLDLSQYDKIFFGTPTYGSNPAAIFNAFLENCINGDGKEWVIFATCRIAGGKIFDRMREVIGKKGGKVVDQRLFKDFFKIKVEKAQEFGRTFNK